MNHQVPMSPEVHAQRHKDLHKALDELLADYIDQTGALPSEINMIEFLAWSHAQATNPTVKQ